MVAARISPAKRVAMLVAGAATVAALSQVAPFGTPATAAPAHLASTATSTSATQGSTIGFGPTTVVDDQRAAGEPDVKVCGPSATWSYGNCGLDNPYSSVPWGFSTTSSFIWRSEDRGHTFKLVPSNNGTGKPEACPGGGDTDLSVSPGASQTKDFLSFIDLQALTNFSSAVSKDGGQSFACNPVSSAATAVDRQWFGVYRNLAGAPANGPIVYLDYDIAAGSLACPTNQSANGNLLVVQKSTDGGLTYSPVTPVDCNDGIAGNMQVNQTNGHVFAVHTAYSSPTQGTTDQVTVNRSTDSGTTWSRAKVFSCGGTCVVGQDFAVLAIDKAGGLYSVWSQAPVDAAGNITGPSHIFLSYSKDDGLTWTPERQVDHGGTDVNLFGWIAAGNAGAVDVVWYGTTKSSVAASYDPGSQTTDWFPYLSQSLNANSSSPKFSVPVRVAQHPNHNGGICTNGIGCTTGGDRSLADFFQVDVNKEGGADVVWADTSNNGNNRGNQGALIDEARQISGTTLFGTSLSGTLTTCTAVTATPCQTDQQGDARYEANGIIGQNTPKLDITGSSVNLDPGDPSKLDVRLKVANLTSLPNASDGILGGPFVDYLTSWNYHIPGNTQAQYDSTGNVYYAYLEVNTADPTAPIIAYDGNTCSLATTHPKYLVYPGQNKITAMVNQTSGTIDLLVPVADVGTPPVGASLYSVTAHTVSQLGPAGPDKCSSRDPNGNNQDATGQVFNVYDKSAAYTSILTTSSGGGGGCHEGDANGHTRDGSLIQADADACEDHDGDKVQNDSAGHHFASTTVDSVVFNDGGGTMTMTGTGLDNGNPVTFVAVATSAAASGTALGTFSLTLSDGYIEAGPLVDGSVTL